MVYVVQVLLTACKQDQDGTEEGSDQLITVLSVTIFVFVGVDSKHVRYVLDFEVTVQGLVGDVPGGTGDYSEHF